MKDIILSAFLVTCILSMKTGQGSAQTGVNEGNSGAGDSGTGGVTPCTTVCNEGATGFGQSGTGGVTQCITVCNEGATGTGDSGIEGATGTGDSGIGGVTPCTTGCNEGDSGPGVSGTGSSPQCPTGGCPVYCSCNDDPHMMTFDGSFYEMQQEGKFYLYKHSTQPIWVQGFFQSCGYNGAFCSCGAAVRYFGETFVVDKCQRPGGVQANVVAKLGTGNSLHVDAYFPAYQISVPGALSVLLGSYGLGIGTILLITNPTDLNSIGGLCGKYDGYFINDFTWRSGELTVAGTTYPYGFADSWRVPLAEDLFSGYTLDSLAPCVEVANATFVPPGVADACFLNITPSAIMGSDSDGSNPTGGFTGQTGGAGRRRRQIGIDFPNGAWPEGFSYASALQYCTDYLFASQAASACTGSIPVPIAVEPFIENCARDIQLTGGTSFATVALTALLAKCVTVMETFNINNPIIEQNLCPFDCSGNGVCSQGSCVCNSGWFGISCSQSISQVPSITNIVPNSDCPPLDSSTVCYAVYLYGGPFISSDTLSANGVIYKVTTPLQTRHVQVELTYISAGLLGARIRLSKCPWNKVGFAFAVKVSNDGVSYSSDAATIVFNP